MEMSDEKSGTTKKQTAKQKKRLPNLVLLLGSFGLLCLVLFIIFNGSKKSSPALSKEISVADAYELYQTGVLFVDVREQEEWDEIRIPNSTHISLGELTRRQKELSKDQQIVVVCRSGNRSQTGRDILLNAGFTGVTSMAGGVKSWSAAGYPTVTGE
jgi:rhodanese-related sulfurtransferase